MRLHLITAFYRFSFSAHHKLSEKINYEWFQVAGREEEVSWCGKMGNKKGTGIGACRTGVAGFEPTNDGVKVRCLTAWLYPNRLGDRGESNPRMSVPQTDALTTSPRSP